MDSQVKVRCNVATSWETGKLDLQLMLSLNLLVHNTWSFIRWWLYILWYPINDHNYVLLIVMQELGCFELVYVKFLMKSKSHETRSSMKLTGRGNMYDQSTGKWQHYANIYVQWYPYIILPLSTGNRMLKWLVSPSILQTSQILKYAFHVC